MVEDTGASLATAGLGLLLFVGFDVNRYGEADLGRLRERAEFADTLDELLGAEGKREGAHVA